MDSKVAEQIVIEFGQRCEASACTRKRKTRPLDLDFAKSAVPRAGDARHSAALLQWLTALPQKEVEKVFCLQNRWLTSMLQQMLKAKATQGEGFFALSKAAREIEVDRLDNYFYFKRKILSQLEHPGPEVAADKEFEQYLRLVDTSDYLDTLTLSRLATSDVPGLVRLMKTLTKGEAFSVPCKAYWVNEYKTWAWESPAWFNNSEFYTLATWSCLAFERNVWTKYCESTHIDPRHKGETQRYVNELLTSASFFAEKHSLNDFWEQLDIRSRLETIGDLQKYVAEYIESKPFVKDPYPELPKKGYAQPYFIEGMRHHLVGQCAAVSVNISALRSKLYSYNSEECVELIKSRALESPPSEFIDFLLSSPIDRAYSMLDSIARRVGVLIRQAESAKEAEDLLLLTEEAEQIKKSTKQQRSKTKKAKKTQKHRRILSNASAVSAKSVSTNASVCTTLSLAKDEDSESVGKAAPVSCQAFKDTGGQDSVDLKERPSSEAGTPEPMELSKEETKSDLTRLALDSDSFEIKCKKPKRRPKRKTPSVALPQLSKVSPTKPKAAEPQELQAKPAPAEKRKALAWSYTNLHFDIVRFVNSTLSKVNLYATARLQVIQRLSEIVGVAFPGTSLELYGSLATGLALVGSDLDVAVVGVHITRREDIQECVVRLSAELQGVDWILQCQGIATASVPVVKLVLATPETESFRVDITFDDGGVLGQHMGLWSLSLTRTYLLVYPTLQQLVIVIKRLLEKHSLNSSYEGGLSSYSVTLWCVAYINSLAEKPEDLGTLLLGFLEHYGLKFSPDVTGISIVSGG
jgi:hypothetical protein